MDVSRSALIARINRKLSAEGERLRVNRSARWQSDLGNFYVVDASRNVVCQRDELAPLARARRAAARRARGLLTA